MTRHDRHTCLHAMAVACWCAAYGARPVSINATGPRPVIHLDRRPAGLLDPDDQPGAALGGCAVTWSGATRSPKRPRRAAR